jgi:hypothetical protein
MVHGKKLYFIRYDMREREIWDRLVVFCVLRVSSNNKTDCHNIVEILLKVALNTIALTLTLTFFFSP